MPDFTAPPTVESAPPAPIWRSGLLSPPHTAALGRPAQWDPQHLSAQRDSLQRSDRLHAQATRAWLGIAEDMEAQPERARETLQGLAAAMVTQVCEDSSPAARLLSKAVGTRRSRQVLNITTLALMLARHMGLSDEALHTVALTALQLGIEQPAPPASPHPVDRQAEAATLAERIVALMSRYDRLCHPSPHGEMPLGPQDALIQLRAQCSHSLDASLLERFVQTLGLFPPGSLVQLSDERIAVVVAVHPDHPQRPSVRVYDPRTAPELAPLLHLNLSPGLSVQRGLPPHHLPDAMRDYLLAHDRMDCYLAQGLEAPHVNVNSPWALDGQTPALRRSTR